MLMMKIIPTKRILTDVKSVISKLNSTGFDYLVAGGTMLQFYLAKYARFSSDLDIVTCADLDEVEKLFRKTFDVLAFSIHRIDKTNLLETFSSLIDIDGQTILVEGMRVSFYKDIKRIDCVIDDVPFVGVSVEFILAEKVDALINDDISFYKHLVDLYSASLFDESLIDKREIKKYLLLFINSYHQVRESLGLKEETVSYRINPNIKFKDSYLLAALQASHNISLPSMKIEVNKYLKLIGEQ